MRIRSISVQGMWSFDGDGVQIDELSDHNIFIGKNNSGKSNILRSLLFIQKNQVQLSSGDRFPVDDLELHKKGKAERGCSPQMLVNTLPEQSDIPHIMNYSSGSLPNEAERDLLKRTLKSGVLFGFKEFDSSSKTAAPLFKFIAAPTRADCRNGLWTGFPFPSIGMTPLTLSTRMYRRHNPHSRPGYLMSAKRKPPRPGIESRDGLLWVERFQLSAEFRSGSPQATIHRFSRRMRTC